ncbi:YadA family autotransporter adhesin [Haemophilus haemolyticus]|uniref:YadA family autotransporter adhesin n=1 Tax=Haemophilus haemolyticus TaxID=726 RepID=UPI000E584166|nr:YadA-like family protein [Haemophilus haemolyticus]
MINNSGFTLKADKVDGGENTTNGDNANNEKLTEKGELIKPGSTVTMKAGKNMTVKHEKDGNITYATKDDVEFNTVKVGNDKDGKSPVEFKTEAAKPATNNVAGKQPTTALNITSSDGKPTQITGVASSLNKSPVTTAPNGKNGAKPDDNLVDLANATTPNAAATVGDLQNMGWIVGAPENGYVDTVKNANKVDFKAGAGISVTGKTKDGVREITIGIKDGEVVKPNEDPSSPNTGAGYVTGNKVATAIQKSGFVIGKQTAALASEDFKNEDEKVNPDDQVRFADGNNTKVKLATKESVNNDGTKVTTTTVKVDVTGLPVQYTDKNGTPVTKVGDKYFTVDKDGNPTTTEVKPADLTTNMVNPAAKPNEIGAPTTLGNVKSNLPSVNDADKNAKDVDGNPIAGKDNKSAPIDAAKAADIAKNAGNNAATVSDVLNAGWNLQNNGEARDFVKPYDTVNFVDGKGTKVVVETTNGTTSNVKFDIDTGKITNNDDGSVQGPVTPEMKKALDDAKKALADATTPEAKKAAQDKVDAAQANIDNVGNPIATVQNIADAINNSGFTLKTSENGGKKLSGKDEIINPGKKVEMVAGKNMTVKQESNGKVTYATASNVTFDSVQFGDNGPKITNNGGNINVGTATGAPTKITGVAPGEISATSKDAVNGSQLYAMGNKLQGQINKLGNRMNAGMATSAAMANLLQPHKPGQSVATAGVGQHKNQSAVAVGYSRISDNGKYGVRFSMGANTQGEVTGGAAVGYFW